MSVEGVGPLRLPISPDTARRLIAVAERAPFGRGEETLYDRTVRDTWQIGEEALDIYWAAWNRHLASALQYFHDDLGLPEGTLVAEPDKLLIYSEGQFFAPHQDSERDDDMIGTLVIDLPSEYSGGALVVEHQGERKRFQRRKRDAEALSLVAFYADCRHEVRPVKAGFRVCLTYRLGFEGDAISGPARPPEELVEPLVELLRDHFDTPIPPPSWSRKPALRPDRLVYLLDHEYTQRSLGWEHLKGQDRARVEVLLEAARRLDAEVFLALANIHEHWSCVEEGGYRRRGWRRHYDYDEDGDGSYELQELLENTVKLSHWIDAEGDLLAEGDTAVSDDEVCDTVPNSELEPYESEHEGWMGNYGNTVDRWYRRAAFACWPRAKQFELRSQVDAAWGLAQVVGRLDAKDIEGARDLAGRLAPLWESAASAAEDTPFDDVCRVAIATADPEVAAILLRPVGLHSFEGRAGASALAGLTERYGAAWTTARLEDWLQRRRYNSPRWEPLAPDLCEALTSRGDQPSVEVATWLAERLATSTDRAWTATPDWAFHDATRDLTLLYEYSLSLIDACTRSAQPAILDSFVDDLLERKTPVLGLVALLEASAERFETPPPALARLFDHCTSELATTCAAPRRAQDDWSLPAHRTCRCALCEELARFLEDPSRVSWDWPLRKDRRRHIHGVIGSSRLPLLHETLRRGSPYILQLRKKSSLFELDATRRARETAALAWLTQQRDRCADT